MRKCWTCPRAIAANKVLCLACLTAYVQARELQRVASEAPEALLYAEEWAQAGRAA